MSSSVSEMERIIKILLQAQVLAPTIAGFIGWIRKMVEEAKAVVDTRDGTEYGSADEALAAGVPAEFIKRAVEVPSTRELADMIDRIAPEGAGFNRDEIARLKAKLAEQQT